MGLNVAMISPWKVRCGIASYTEDLATAMPQHDAEVYIVRLPRFGLKTPGLVQDVAERVPYQKIDVVHVQHEYGLYQSFESPFYEVLRAHGKPIVTTMHSVGNWEIDGLIAGISKTVIVHNKFCEKRFGFPKTVIVPHGARLRACQSRKYARCVLGINPDVPVVGYLGFISNYKGLEDLIEAMVGVPKTGLLIAGGYHVEGDTPYIDKLKRGAEKLLGERVKWRGFIPDERMALMYAAMDVLVYPSRWATESGALITALSYGKATIARDLPPFKEKEEQEALLTFSDVKDLGVKITNVLKDSDLRAKLESQALKYSESVAWPLVARQHIDIYNECLK